MSTTKYIKQELDGKFKISDDNSSWTDIPSNPFTIVNTNLSSVLTVRFETDLTITDNTVKLSFGIGSDNITIDGNSKNVTITNVSSYSGLIRNGTSDFDGKQNITVKNINTHSSNSSLTGEGGWICRSYFGRGALNNKIENCSNTGAINNSSAGGICGTYAGIFNGNCTITNCYNTGAVSGNNAGGICGSYNENCTITNCYNTGAVSGISAGGICGQTAGYKGNCTITNCSNTGAVSGISAGGICGRYAGINNGKCTITNCYNTGVVNGTSAGGICGTNAGDNGKCLLTNCYTLYNPLSTTTTVSSGTTGFFTVNCYLASGTWNDIDANAALVDGVPVLGSIFGSAWVSLSPGTPYLLKSFNKEVYSIKSVVASESPFISESGLFPSPFKYEMLGVNDNSSISSSDFTIDENGGVIRFGSSITTGIYKIDVFVYNNSNEIDGVKLYDGYNFNTLTVDAEVVPLSNICFLGNTLITTDQGECRIDEIDVKYHTLDGKSILKITKSLSVDNYLVRFGKGSLGLNVPSRCTVMTPNHSLMYNGELIEARNFLNGFDNIRKLCYRGEIVYNVLLNVAGTMKVNNLICETLNPCNGMARLLVYLDRLNLSDRNDLLLCYNDYFKVNKCFPKSLCYKNGRHFLR